MTAARSRISKQRQQLRHSNNTSSKATADNASIRTACSSSKTAPARNGSGSIGEQHHMLAATWQPQAGATAREQAAKRLRRARGDAARPAAFARHGVRSGLGIGLATGESEHDGVQRPGEERGNREEKDGTTGRR